MFFLMGVNTKKIDLDYRETKICDICGSYGGLSAYMYAKELSIFFIPIIKWDKEYYIKTSCCNSVYGIKRNIGYDIERGKSVAFNLSKQELVKVGRKKVDKCPNCGYNLSESYKYCPSCGKEIN